MLIGKNKLRKIRVVLLYANRDTAHRWGYLLVCVARVTDSDKKKHSKQNKKIEEGPRDIIIAARKEKNEREKRTKKQTRKRWKK